MQLAGRVCAVCGQVITGIREGRFCPACSSPVHIRCSFDIPAGHDKCRECGAPKAVGRDVQSEDQWTRRSLGRTLARQDIGRGLIAITGGFLLACGAILLAFVTKWGFCLFTTAAVITVGGVIMLVRGLTRIRHGDSNDYPDTAEPDG